MHQPHTDLERMIAAAARFLPPQGPIDAFVAQNPLQGFEHLPFEEAVVRAARAASTTLLENANYRKQCIENLAIDDAKKLVSGLKLFPGVLRAIH